MIPFLVFESYNYHPSKPIKTGLHQCENFYRTFLVCFVQVFGFAVDTTSVIYEKKQHQ